MILIFYKVQIPKFPQHSNRRSNGLRFRPSRLVVATGEVQSAIPGLVEESIRQLQYQQPKTKMMAGVISK